MIKSKRVTIKSDDLLRHIERLPNQSAGYKQLLRELNLKGSDQRRELADALHALVRSRRLLEVERDRFTLPAAAATRQNLVSGCLSMHRDGYGFVLPDDKILRDKISGDIYIPPPATLNAMHGDRVLVEVGPIRQDGRAEGRIVRIAERRHVFVVGKFHSRAEQNYVDPMDEKIGQVVVIPPGKEVPEADHASNARYGRSTAHRVIGDQTSAREYPLLENVVVNVEITEFPAGQGNPKGRVVEILGYEDEFGVDVEIVIRKHHLPHVFPEDALAEARELAADEAGFRAEAETRTDFRHLPIVTIDGETARDFDDAVMVRRKANGNYELHVHIADVAQYVTPFSALDDEARLRGNSVYFPDRAIPMLPLELSTDLCSLRPQLDRLVMSCIMEVDHQGGIAGYELHEGVIRSAARMTYTKVQAILDGDPAAQQEYAALVPEFKRMEELARILNRKRQQRGAIDFDLPEPVIDFDQQGMMQGVTRSERKFSNRLIEEFMLAANECVAEYLEQRNIASLYRIHEKPDPKKVFEFEVLATSFGYSLGVGALPVKKIQLHADRREQQRRGNRRIQPRTIELPQEVHITPRMYQKLTEKIAGKPEERILSYLMLRSLKQARYSEKNEGHFALAAPTYTHFTSPIRRYPDLIVHRLLKAVLRGQAQAHVTDHKRVSARQNLIEVIPEDELHEIADHASETERAAADAERELIEWKKAQFMVQHIGEEYHGLIVSITKFGMFVELMDLFVEGLVPLDTMQQQESFRFHENTRQMIGERWGTTYSMGDRVRVIVDRVDIGAHKINFSLVEENKEVARGKAKTKARRKSARPEAVEARAAKKGRRERTSKRQGTGRKNKKRK
ncbi:MAG: VacB/RNase II family 3'-5' exoribonuclease [Acidobacteriaceae bacterium]